MFEPVFRDYRAWRATWTKLVWRRHRTGRGSSSTILASSSSRISAATRSRSRRTTSSRFRRLSTAESGSKGTIAHRRLRLPSSMANDITQTTLVLGGGPAGLTAGYLLGKRDRDVVVLEAEDQVGGLAKTVERDGYRFDLGGHRFFTKALEVDDLWHEVLGDEFLRRPRMSRIYWNKRYLDYPLRGPDVIKKLGPVELARCMALVPRGRGAPEGRGGFARAVGDEPVRPPPLRALLQELQREGLGRSRRPRSAPSGRRSASRGCRSSPPRGRRSSATGATRSRASSPSSTTRATARARCGTR